MKLELSSATFPGSSETLLERFRLRETLPVSLLLGAAFIVLFLGSEWIAGLRTTRFLIHFPFELRIPFFAFMAPVYLSVQLLLILPLFYFPSREEIMPVALTLLFQMVTAAIVFVACPVLLVYPPPPSTGVWAPLVSLADALNLDLNLFPSLHVAFAISCSEMIGSVSESLGRWLFRAWAALIALSTIFLHQHHLLDVISGAFLAYVSIKAVFQPLKRSS